MSEDNNATVEQSVQETPVTPEPATSQGKTEGQQTGSDDIIQLTPAQLKERLARTEKSVLNGILEGLGVDSVDTLKSTLEADKKRREAEMSETEKLQAELEALKQSVAEKDAAIEQAEQARLDDKRDSSLKQLLSKAHDADVVLTIIKSNHDVSDLMSDGIFNKDKAEKLVNTFASEKPYLFSSGAPGTLSNRDGRVPNPDKKTEEKAANEWLARLRS